MFRKHPRRRIALGFAIATGSLSLALFALGAILASVNSPTIERNVIFVLAIALTLFASAWTIGFLVYLIDMRRQARRHDSQLNEIRGVEHSLVGKLERSEDISKRLDDILFAVGRTSTSQIDAITSSSALVLDDLSQLTDIISKAQEATAATSQQTKDHLDTALDRLLTNITSKDQEATAAIDRLESAIASELNLYTDRLYPLIDGLTSTYSSLDARGPLPPMRGWAVSPDLAAFLIATVLRLQPSLIVETGSGISSALMGLALKKLGKGRVISLENDTKYAKETRELLNQQGVAHVVNVVVAELIPYEFNGTHYEWYDASAFELEGMIDLLFVDGPPGPLAAHSRYPALPLLKQHLNSESVIVVDDAERTAEKQIIEMWNKDVGPLDVTYIPHEKGTAVIQRRYDT